MANLSLVVLDVGGTIVEDRGEVPTALLSALNEHGLQVTPEDIRPLRGASKEELIATLVARRWGAGDAQNQARTSAIYAAFQLALERAYSGNGVKPIAGVHAAIGWLREQGVAVAANTGFSRHITGLVLSRAGLAGLFDTVVADDDVPKGRPAPFMIFHAMENTGVTDVRSVVNIGDTPLDLQAGCNSGVAGVVGVATGAYSSDELMKHPHTHIIASVAALPHLVESATGIPRIVPRNGHQL